MPQGIEAPASVTAEGPTSHTQNQAAGLAKLRVPFPKDQINPLPKIICGKCSKSPTKECEKHRKGKCHECDNWITSAHMHLDYVGHAELTNRLLDADPLWDWEPLALDERGLPVFDGYGGLWIRLTVCGHSRLGYGDSQGKTGPNAIKEAIGDALRNAAMRFGAALDLWAKSDLREAQTEHPKTAEDDGYVSDRPSPARQEEVSARRTEPSGSVPGPPSEHLAKLLRQVADCWNSNNILIFNQIGEDASQHGLLDEEFMDKRGAVTTLRKVLDGRIAEIQAAQGGGEQRAA